MPGHRMGYVRISNGDQHLARQLEGVAVDRAFTDTASGKDAQPPQLEQLLAVVHEGDTLPIPALFAHN